MGTLLYTTRYKRKHYFIIEEENIRISDKKVNKLVKQHSYLEKTRM